MPTAFQISTMYCRQHSRGVCGPALVLQLLSLQCRAREEDAHLANSLDLIEIATHLVVELRKPVSHPASVVCVIQSLQQVKHASLARPLPEFECNTTLGQLVDIQSFHYTLQPQH